VLLPACCVPRRRDGADVIGAALLAKAQGAGQRTIAARLESRGYFAAGNSNPRRGPLTRQALLFSMLVVWIYRRSRGGAVRRE